MTIQLPQVALDFLSAPEGRNGKRPVRLFHGWMERKNCWLKTLTRDDVDAFLANPAEKPILATTRNGYRYILFRYLDWLRAREFISFDSAWLRVRRQALPESAENFCVFHAIPITDSTGSRSPVPREADHRFHGNPISDSAGVDHPVGS